MAQTRISCPRCRQPVMADIEQLYDMNTDSQAKQKILSGAFNLLRCPSCGFEGNYPSYLVYHDPDKELLLTYFPPDLGLPVNEQERIVGPLITKVVDRLPNEKRKAYIFRPQTMLTMQTMVEKILEGEGITKEMLDAQQKRMTLLQKLMTAPEDSRLEIVKQEEELIDESFFTLLNRIIETAMAQEDNQSVKLLADIQKFLTTNTKYGKELKIQAQSAEKAMKTLQDLSKDGGLTREKVLDLVIAAESDIEISTYVSLVRAGMDYAFFQQLTQRIDDAAGEEKTRLTALREKLLEMTSRLDQQIKERLTSASKLFEDILKAEDVEKETEKNLAAVDDFFVDVLKTELQSAQQRNDETRLAKIQHVVNVIQKASAPPPEIELVEKMLEAPDEAARQKIFEENADKITPDFVNLLNTLASQTETQGKQPDLVAKLKDLYRAALRFSMEANLKK
ncbi:MAG: CpXC domain-containing protein [Anaerolineaceae bacterium]